MCDRRIRVTLGVSRSHRSARDGTACFDHAFHLLPEAVASTPSKATLGKAIRSARSTQDFLPIESDFRQTEYARMRKAPALHGRAA